MSNTQNCGSAKHLALPNVNKMSPVTPSCEKIVRESTVMGHHAFLHDGCKHFEKLN